jgi:GT2 family glycosyltransferase
MALTPVAARKAARRDAALDGATTLLAAAICTRARPDRLRRAIASLVTQSTPLAEILVVDDARLWEADAVAVASSFKGVRYVRGTGSGLNIARNAALANTRAPIVAFLDDDAVAAPDWSTHMLAAFEDPAVGACTGRVEPLALDTPGQITFEANGGYARGRERIELPRDARRHRLHGLPAPLIAWAVSIGNGCSLAVRREAALQISGFDEVLDNGEDLPGGGDHDLLWRLLGNGWKIVYEPRSQAWHEHRALENDAIAQIADHQRALVAFLMKSLSHARVRTSLPIAAFLAWRLVKPGLRLARRLVGYDVLPARALLRMWRECWHGISAYSGGAARPRDGDS